MTFFWPGLTARVLLFFIAGWAIAIGVLEIIGAIKLRKEIDNEWFLILSGVLSVLFGVLHVLPPGAGALALVWVIGTFAIVFGLDLIWLAFKLKGYKDKIEPLSGGRRRPPQPPSRPRAARPVPASEGPRARRAPPVEAGNKSRRSGSRHRPLRRTT